jgi:hypothetical protein
MVREVRDLGPLDWPGRRIAAEQREAALAKIAQEDFDRVEIPA